MAPWHSVTTPRLGAHPMQTARLGHPTDSFATFTLFTLSLARHFALPPLIISVAAIPHIFTAIPDTFTVILDVLPASPRIFLPVMSILLMDQLLCLSAKLIGALRLPVVLALHLGRIIV